MQGLFRLSPNPGSWNVLIMSSTDKTNMVSVPFLRPSFGTARKQGKQTNQQLCDLATEAQQLNKYIHMKACRQASYLNT